jgi:1,4-dihydroxy-2-naphthoyl-CoA hydrolase
MSPHPDALRDSMPFARELGIEITVATPDAVEAHLAHRPELCTLGEALHGGALMTLADSAGAVCAFLNLPEGAQGTSTLESKTNLLRAVRCGSAHAMSRPLHAGRRTIVVETEVRDDDGRLVAKTTQTQTVL